MMRINPERFVKNVIPDLRDNFESKEPPTLVVEKIKDPVEAVPLVERLLPKQIREGLVEEVSRLAPGQYRARVSVGSQEEGTRHPHDFIVDKVGDRTKLYFIDPEHQMGKSKKKSSLPLPRKGDLRPKISTLIGIKLSQSGGIPELSIIRFRAAAITDPHLLKMGPQFELAKQLLETGDLPELLRGKENEITFRVNVRPDTLLAQSRYASPSDVSGFLRGEKTATALEGKIYSSTIIMGHFLKHLKEGQFQVVDTSQS